MKVFVFSWLLAFLGCSLVVFLFQHDWLGIDQSGIWVGILYVCVLAEPFLHKSFKKKNLLYFHLCSCLLERWSYAFGCLGSSYDFDKKFWAKLNAWVWNLSLEKRMQQACMSICWSFYIVKAFDLVLSFACLEYKTLESYLLENKSSGRRSMLHAFSRISYDIFPSFLAIWIVIIR